MVGRGTGASSPLPQARDGAWTANLVRSRRRAPGSWFQPRWDSTVAGPSDQAVASWLPAECESIRAARSLRELEMMKRRLTGVTQRLSGFLLKHGVERGLAKRCRARRSWLLRL